MANLKDSERIIKSLQNLISNQHISSCLPEDIKNIELVMQELIKSKIEFIESKEQFESIFNTNPSPTIITTLDEGIIVNINQAYLNLFGYTKDEVIGETTRFKFYENPDDRQIALSEITKNGFYENLKINFHKKNGDKIIGLFSGKVVSLNGIPHLISVVLDITEQALTEQKLKESEEKYRRLFENAVEMIVVIQDLKIKIYNPIFAQLTGYSNEEIENTLYWEFIHTDERQFIVDQHIKRLNDTAENEISSFKLIKKDKSIIWVELNAIKIEWEGRAATLSFLTDVTERKNKENEILYLSYHDQLTGLYNRRFYEEELHRLDKERNLPLSIIMADVNGLKLTNDAFGHIAGDKILMETANIIKEECRSDDIVARVGGDEFIILLPSTSTEEASNIVERINKSIQNKRIENTLLSVSFGVATKYDKNEKVSVISILAEDNMYHHKLIESNLVKKENIKLIFNSLYGENKEEERHSRNVSELCEKLAIALEMNEKFINDIKLAGLMHDIGKVAVDKNILNKTSPLSEHEKIELAKHAEVGYHILKSVTEYSNLAEYIVTHHERLDGKGYPKGLEAKDIPYPAKIIAVVEAYDVMTNDNPYKRALSKEEAIKELIKNSGIQFDSEIVKMFIKKVLKSDISINITN